SRLTARENVELPLMLCGVAPTERHRRSQQLLASLGLGNRADHRPAELSGGQRQRVAIARAMVTQPRLLLADEPTGNLDSRSGEEVIALLERLNRERGVTLVVVTHDERIGARAGRRIRMNDGRLEPPC
uniref:ABC transporter ATP-binding protein n=1 Tax=Aeromonas taiwanensis TaxID=633417 RepID=UPI003B9F3894